MTDAELWDNFHSQSLSHAEWSHRAHVRIAYLHLSRFHFPDALQGMRESIKKLNASHGVIETEARGYNETITVAFLRIVDSLMRNYPVEGGSEDFCEQNPQIMTPRVLRLYYSRQRLWEIGAKDGFLEPDLGSLPH